MPRKITIIGTLTKTPDLLFSWIKNYFFLFQMILVGAGLIVMLTLLIIIFYLRIRDQQPRHDD